MRQKPESYDPRKDSPLIGGHGKEKKWFTVMFDGRDFPQAEGDGGAAHCMKTCDVITLLEQAAEGFPKSEVLQLSWLGGEFKDISVYDANRIDAWKRKWLTVPPI